jgi:hypothetical protein
MTSLPYRHAVQAEPVKRCAPHRLDADMLPALALLWVVSLIRVAGGLLRHEAFGTEATLALMAVLVLPWLAFARAPRT